MYPEENKDVEIFTVKNAIKERYYTRLSHNADVVILREVNLV